MTFRTMQIDGREVHVYHDGIGCRPMSALEVTLWKERNELADVLRDYMGAVRYADSNQALQAAIKAADDSALAILARLDAERS